LAIDDIEPPVPTALNAGKSRKSGQICMSGSALWTGKGGIAMDELGERDNPMLWFMLWVMFEFILGPTCTCLFMLHPKPELVPRETGPWVRQADAPIALLAEGETLLAAYVAWIGTADMGSMGGKPSLAARKSGVLEAGLTLKIRFMLKDDWASRDGWASNARGAPAKGVTTLLKAGASSISLGRGAPTSGTSWSVTKFSARMGSKSWTKDGRPSRLSSG
jgi:hypothetical protein